jgi:MscS family membrane protein
LDLEVFAYILAPDKIEFLAIQEDVLLRIMDLVAESGTSIAFPSQTTYFARDTPVDGEQREHAEAHVRAWRDRGELPFPDFGPRQAADLQVAVEYPPEGSVLRNS